MLPGESIRWQALEEISRKVFRAFGYFEIRTPVMEETGLFVKSVGEETDIVRKEMFSFQDRGDRDITLRPEGTAPIIRAYLENNLDKTEPFQKLYYIGPMFRAERPQAGRLRQFHQIGVEAVGSSHPALDAEVIALLVRLLDSIGVEGYKLKLNNLGCKSDKKKLSADLREAFLKKSATASLCEDCRRRLATNPLRIIDCKIESCKYAVREHFKKTDFICADCKAHFEAALKYLDLLKIPYVIDPYIVRGLDYYTRTVFEVSHDSLGAQNAVAAGGRYDCLVKDMGGEDAGACGFAIGVDRAMLVLEKSRKDVKPSVDIFIANIGDVAYERAFLLADDLRKAGVSCEIDYEKSSLKSEMRSADKLGAKFVLIIGDDELVKGEASLRDMKTKEQIMVKFADIVNVVKEKIG